MGSDQSGRLDALEARMMHQDQTIEDLNVTMTDQWRHIDRLSRLIQQLEGKLNDMTLGTQAPDQPPPHY